MTCEEATRFIDPYVDGELELAASLELEAHLAGCEACQRQVEQRRALATLVREEAPRFAAPPFLATRIRAQLRAQNPALDSPPAAENAPRLPWWLGAWIYPALGVAVAVVALALVITFLVPRQPTEMAREAIADHVRSLQVSHLLDVASTDQHTVKPWFAGKLDFAPQVIDLGPSGYPLIGGRLDVLCDRPVAAIIYQRRKHYINLFIWPAGHEPVGTLAYEAKGYHVLGWTKSGMNYLAVSELGVKELRDFTGMIREQIVPPME
ncbi:MAG: anti-sigma factor [Verrucomicrobiota bacterium]